MLRTFVALLTICGLAAPALADATDVPRQVISESMDQVLSVLKQPDLPNAEKESRIESIAYARFDFDSMSKLVLGRSYRKLSPEQRTEFGDEFKKHLSLTYGRRLTAYTNERIEIGDARLEPNGDVSVKTRVVGGSVDGVEIDYRMRERNGEWLVIDVIIENVSLIANFRSQIQGIIRTEGPEGLIEKLRQKNNERAAEVATS